LTGCVFRTVPLGYVWQLSAWPWVGSACRNATHLRALYWALYVPHDVAPTKCTGRPANPMHMQRPAHARPHACPWKDALHAAASALRGCQRQGPRAACMPQQPSRAGPPPPGAHGPPPAATLQPLQRLHTLTRPITTLLGHTHARTRMLVGETPARPKRALQEVAYSTHKKKENHGRSPSYVSK